MWKNHITIIVICTITAVQAHADDKPKLETTGTKTRVELVKELRAEMAVNYARAFREYVSSDVFDEFLSEREEYAKDQNFNIRFYISGFIRGFLASLYMDDLNKTGTKQGDDLFMQGSEVLNDERRGYIDGRNQGNLFGRKLEKELLENFHDKEDELFKE